jgi:hypothetical protein
MTPEERKDLLLNLVKRFAEIQMQEFGGITPFGATLGLGRDVILIKPKSTPQEISPDQLTAYFQKRLLEAVSKKPLTAVCYCAHVLAKSTTGEMVPGLFVHFEQPEGVSENMAYPFTIGNDSKLNFGPPTCVPVELEVFRPSSSSDIGNS